MDLAIAHEWSPLARASGPGQDAHRWVSPAANWIIESNPVRPDESDPEQEQYRSRPYALAIALA